jgi:hypothetical protein
MILVQRPGVSCEGMGERGSNSFFAQKFIFLFEPRQFICDLLPRCLPAFLTLSLPSTVAFGLNFECSFSWKVFHVESSIIYGGTRHGARWQMIG